VLAFKDQGKAQVRVQYLGPAPLNDRGSELMALNDRLRNGDSAPVMTAALAMPAKRANYAPRESFSTAEASGGFFVQVGSFRDPDNAERTRVELAGSGPVVITAVSGAAGELYRVRIGPLPDATQAQRALQDAVNAGHSDAKLVTAQGVL
jgi:rare lipoprotein A